MDSLTLVVALLAAVLGAVAGYALAARRRAVLATRNAALAAQLQERERALGRLEESIEDLIGVREQLAHTQASLEHERRGSAEKLALVEQAKTNLRDAFQSLSAEALKSNNQAFLDLARASLGEFQQQGRSDLDQRQRAIEGLMKPVTEVLGQLDLNLRELERSRIEAFTELKGQVASLLLNEQRLERETGNLVRALRAPAVRGRWGEIQLQRVVELAGMLDHCDFSQQPGAVTDAGRQRPDLVVRLPGGRNIVVDAKVPIEAYLKGLEADGEAEREALLADHARQVRDHMTRLGGKSYWEQFQPTPEFVVMFLPGESFFSAAAQKDPALIEHGVGQKVLPASPTTLIAMLRAAAFGWQQEATSRNAQAIGDLGKTLYQRLSVMAGQFDELRRGLDRAVEAYNKAAGWFERRVLVSARRFADLGVATAEPIEDLRLVESSPRTLDTDDEPAIDTAPEDEEQRPRKAAL